MADWQPGKFVVANYHDTPVKAGFVNNGLGLFHVGYDTWSLTHLGSGMKVVHLIGEFEEIAPYATEIASLVDWTFDGLEGWRNQDPELHLKIRAIGDRAPDVFGSVPCEVQRGHAAPEFAQKLAQAQKVMEQRS